MAKATKKDQFVIVCCANDNCKETRKIPTVLEMAEQAQYLNLFQIIFWVCYNCAGDTRHFHTIVISIKDSFLDSR